MNGYLMSSLNELAVQALYTTACPIANPFLGHGCDNMLLTVPDN